MAWKSFQIPSWPSLEKSEKLQRGSWQGKCSWLNGKGREKGERAFPGVLGDPGGDSITKSRNCAGTSEELRATPNILPDHSLSKPGSPTGCISLQVRLTAIPAGKPAFPAGNGISLAQAQNSSQNVQVCDVTIPKNP